MTLVKVKSYDFVCQESRFCPCSNSVVSLVSFYCKGYHIGLGLWCLMPLSTTFQLYSGGYHIETIVM
jgi:hypothetical protein